MAAGRPRLERCAHDLVARLVCTVTKTKRLNALRRAMPGLLGADAGIHYREDEMDRESRV